MVRVCRLAPTFCWRLLCGNSHRFQNVFLRCAATIDTVTSPREGGWGKERRWGFLVPILFPTALGRRAANPLLTFSAAFSFALRWHRSYRAVGFNHPSPTAFFVVLRCSCLIFWAVGLFCYSVSPPPFSLCKTDFSAGLASHGNGRVYGRHRVPKILSLSAC